MIKVGIAGGTGYVAGELLRILGNHPEAEVAFIYSHSKPGEAVSAVHRDLFYRPEWRFTDEVSTDVDVVFLCLGHGLSRKFLEEHPLPSEVSVIDLGSDFRLKQDSRFGEREFTYGLAELPQETGKNIANPGCFATAIELALLPIAAKGLLTDSIHVHAITGSTGAGASLNDYSHFSRRLNNLSIYKPFSHQHLAEIGETWQKAGQTELPEVSFLPVKGDFARGIFASVYTATEMNEAEAKKLYQDFYRDKPFVHVSDETIELKQVVGTNHCLIQVQVIDGKLLVTSIIDNLLKGAAGQAVQNMNRIFGLAETTGLNLRSIAF